MDFVNNNIRPSCPHEQRLRNEGHKWVNANTINPTQFSQVKAVVDRDGRPDRLNEHSHHGESTHRIISGDLRIQRSQEPRWLHEISSDTDTRRQDHIPPKTLYSATSRHGCTFVEGHKCLSPESAERFISRGTLNVVDKKRARRSFPTDNQLGIWLRQVKFNPDGKARPNLARGERPILDATLANPPMPYGVYVDLSQWFENEWRGQKQLRNERRVSWVLWSFVIFILCVMIAFRF
ncbi:hypothetical protein F4782DRAFT_534036 [Xylaria castorea]|nr:hypothetical protein F4782DRAFT_534036 [Xylaria castorea]